jgi:hypothetical protein
MIAMTGKELAIRKNELGDLLREAIEHHNHSAAACAAAENARRVAMFHAWHAGIRLNKMKALIRQGDWQDWVSFNLPFSERTARLYMKIDNDNPHLRDAEPNAQRVAGTCVDLEVVTRLKFDTVRKYAIGFVPKKHRPSHKAAGKSPRRATFRNIVNEYLRLKQRHIDGLQLVDFDEAREESDQLYQFLRWLHGDAAVNPWECSPSPR